LDDKELVFDALRNWLNVEILEQGVSGMSKSNEFDDESYLIPKKKIRDRQDNATTWRIKKY